MLKIKEDQHKVQQIGAMNTDGRITPTLGKPNKANWFMSHPEWELILTIAEGTVGAGSQARKRLYLVQGEDDVVHEKLKEGLEQSNLEQSMILANVRMKLRISVSS